MNASLNFDEWTREQKEEYAKQRMLEMRLKNAKMMKRHAEVERDRIEAEQHNSAVTNIVKVISKRERSTSCSESNNREGIEQSREWDIGKPDKEFWTSPEHDESFGSCKSSQFDDGNSGSYKHARNGSLDQNLQNRNVTQHHSSKNSSFNPHSGTKKSNEVQWKSQKSYPHEMLKRIASDSLRIRSRSITNDSDYFEKATKFEKPCLWQNDKISEDKNKHNRVEKWVKSVNKSNHWTKAFFMSEQNGRNKSSSKFDRVENTSNAILNSNNSTTNYNTKKASLKNNRNVPQPETGHHVSKTNQCVVMDRNPSKVEAKQVPTKEAPKEEEGLWGNTEQLDIVWKLSDDETDFLS